MTASAFLITNDDFYFLMPTIKCGFKFFQACLWHLKTFYFSLKFIHSNIFFLVFFFSFFFLLLFNEVLRKYFKTNMSEKKIFFLFCVCLSLFTHNLKTLFSFLFKVKLNFYHFRIFLLSYFPTHTLTFISRFTLLYFLHVSSVNKIILII